MQINDIFILVLGYKFDDLVERLFKEIPLEKLKQSDTQRFEKAWLCDTANKLITLCDKKVQFMLPKTTKEIMEDVLNRFDPRPETGLNYLIKYLRLLWCVCSCRNILVTSSK